MIQFDEHIFQLGWFNCQRATTSSAACLDIFVRFFLAMTQATEKDTQNGERLKSYLENAGRFEFLLVDWNFTSLSDHQIPMICFRNRQNCVLGKFFPIFVPRFLKPILQKKMDETLI